VKLAASLPSSDSPHDAVRENGTYGGQGKAVAVDPPAVLLSESQTQQKQLSKLRPVPGALRERKFSVSLSHMRNDARLELKIPTERRAALSTLAEQSGLSSSDLVRLAINRLLEDRDVRLPHTPEAA
jgi:hypothetical protein